MSLQFNLLDVWCPPPSDVPDNRSHDFSDINLTKASQRSSSKTEILRITRGRLKDDPGSTLANQHQIDNKRKRNSSRENSLESLLEEEDPVSEECVSRDSIGQQNQKIQK